MVAKLTARRVAATDRDSFSGLSSGFLISNARFTQNGAQRMWVHSVGSPKLEGAS